MINFIKELVHDHKFLLAWLDNLVCIGKIILLILGFITVAVVIGGVFTLLVTGHYIWFGLVIILAALVITGIIAYENSRD